MPKYIYIGALFFLALGFFYYSISINLKGSFQLLNTIYAQDEGGGCCSGDSAGGGGTSDHGDAGGSIGGGSDDGKSVGSGGETTNDNGSSGAGGEASGGSGGNISSGDVGPGSAEGGTGDSNGGDTVVDLPPGTPGGPPLPKSPEIYLPSASCSGDSSRIGLTFKAAQDANLYYLYRRTEADANWTFLGAIHQNDLAGNQTYTFYDQPASPNHYYIYHIAAFNTQIRDFANYPTYSTHVVSDIDDYGQNFYGQVYSGWKRAINCANPDAPYITLPISACPAIDNSQLNFFVDPRSNGVNNPDIIYQIFRFDNITNSWSRYGGDYGTTNGSFSADGLIHIRDNVTPNTFYLYYIAAINLNTGATVGAYHYTSELDDTSQNWFSKPYTGYKMGLDCSIPGKAPIHFPPGGFCSGNTSSVSVTLNPASHANYYILYKNVLGESTWTPVKEIFSKDFVGGIYTYQDPSIQPGKSYIYLAFSHNTNLPGEWWKSGQYSIHPESDSDDLGLNWLNSVYSGYKVAPNCTAPVVTLQSVDSFGTLRSPSDPSARIPTNTTINLRWSSANADSCNAYSTPSGYWSITPTKLSGESTTNPLTFIQDTPSTYQFTLTCTNSKLTGSGANPSTSQTIPVDVFYTTTPFLKTTGGDVHSQTGINAPGGPTPAP